MEEKKQKTQDQINKELREKWDKLKLSTQEIRAGEDPYPSTLNSLRLPIYATKSYVYPTMTNMFKHHYFYSRTENPTLYALDKKLATLHGGEDAISVASGMAAVHLACSSILQKRLKRIKPYKLGKFLPQANPKNIPNFVVHKNQYAGTYRLFLNLFPQMGFMPRIVDLRDLNALRHAIDSQTKFIFFETPANPSIDVIDIQKSAEMIHEVNGKCIVDNTFASPALQKPLQFGADLVIESLTKYINGHGDAMGGVIVGPKTDLLNIRYFWLELEGQVMSPFSAWLILRGCRTLSIRMEKHSSTAIQVAQFLENHPKIAKVVYPGLKSHPANNIARKQMSNFGGMIGFELNSKEESFAFIDNLKTIKVGVSLGDTTSLMEYTSIMMGLDLASWEKELMGMSNTHFRFSVGLEDPQDLIIDLEQALNKI